MPFLVQVSVAVAQLDGSVVEVREQVGSEGVEEPPEEPESPPEPEPPEEPESSPEPESPPPEPEPLPEPVKSLLLEAVKESVGAT